MNIWITSPNVKKNLQKLVKELGPKQSHVPYFYGEIKSLQKSKYCPFDHIPAFNTN